MKGLFLLLSMMLAACADGGTRPDAARDMGRDYPVIEGPITRPLVDMPVWTEGPPPDGAADSAR